jgi:hypothetical protein
MGANYGAPILSLILYSGCFAMFLGALCVIKPVRFLRIKTRWKGGAVFLSGFALATLAAVWPTPRFTSEGKEKGIDAFMPVYQFHEFHSTRIHASPAQVFRAVKTVTPREIRFFGTLMGIRRLPERILGKDRLPSLLPNYAIRSFHREDPATHEFAANPDGLTKRRLKGGKTTIEYGVEGGGEPVPIAEILRRYQEAIEARGGSRVRQDGCCRATLKVGSEGAETWIEITGSSAGDRYRLTLVEEGGAEAAAKGPILDLFLRSGFQLVSEKANREIVVGTPDRGPEAVKIACDFRVRDEGGGWSELTTETRVFASDPRVRRKFALYWRIIYPGSATIRRTWLEAIRQRAERQG